jgi:hypothetical protein
VKCSVTSILSGTRDQSGLREWRESIGEERADFIRNTAAFRGTALHTAVENYLQHGELPTFYFLVTPYWNSMRRFVETIEALVIVEAPVWHADGYAGTLDCIAYLPEDDAQPTLLDWKTADKLCNPMKLYEYSLQIAAYRAAANYVYKPQGLQINKGVIAVALPDQAPQIHVLNEDELDQLYLHFLARLRHFTFARR